MTDEYIVGLDSMYSIDAETPDGAEEILADKLSSGDIDVGPTDCVTYERIPRDEEDDDD